MPAAHNSPGFTSFADYLNANQGSLDQERQQALSGVSSAFGTAQGDLTKLTDAASQAGEEAGKAVDDSGGTWDTTTGPHGLTLAYTSAQAPDYTPDPSKPADTTQLHGDLTKAQDQLSALQSGGVPGKTSWEAGLIEGGGGFGQQLQGIGKQYGDLSNYLDQINAAGQSGYQKGLGERTPPAYEGPPATPDMPSQGPVEKPNHGGATVWDPTLNHGQGGRRRLTDDQLP